MGEASGSTVPRVMLDYCFFIDNACRSADEHTEKEEASVSLAALVLGNLVRTLKSAATPAWTWIST